MTLPRIYPILDVETLARRAFPVMAAAEAMLEGGAGILQFRFKGNYTRAIFEQAQCVREACRSAGAVFIVDDRADFAAALDAGVHVGQDDLPPRDARRIVGPDRILGFSTHNPRQFSAALCEPIDYIAFGPVFPTRSKSNPDPLVGLDGVRIVCGDAGDVPLVAIGGIKRENASDVLAAGAASVAVINDLLPPEMSPAGIRERMEEWQRLVKN